MIDLPRRETTYTTCAAEGCTNKYANHRWGKTKADDWFHQKDGTSWCPNHIPDWVAGWRASKR